MSFFLKTFTHQKVLSYFTQGWNLCFFAPGMKCTSNPKSLALWWDFAPPPPAICIMPLSFISCENFINKHASRIFFIPGKYIYSKVRILYSSIHTSTFLNRSCHLKEKIALTSVARVLGTVKKSVVDVVFAILPICFSDT